MTRLAVLTTHPIQYYGPLFRELGRRVDLEVLFAHRASPEDQSRAGFGHAFEWDVDVTGGYAHRFLKNVAGRPGVEAFGGCDTPEIGGVLKAGGYDALLLTGWGFKTYIQGLLAAKRIGLPVVVRGDSHLGTPRSRARAALKRALYPGFLRMFDAAAHVGRRSRDYYLHYGYPAGRLFFSPHCVDNDRFAAGATPEARRELRTRLGVGDDAFVALTVGKMVAGKRPFDVVAAAAACRRRGSPVEVMTAGSGPLEEAVAAAAAEAGVPLRRLGFRNQSELPAVYAASDALVLASDSETWGLVANEALACGRPVIVSDACGCAPDLTEDPAAGRSFRTGDAQNLADVLTRVMTMTPTDARTDAPLALARRYGLSAAADGIEAALGAVVRRRR